MDGLVFLSTVFLVPIAEYSYILKSLEKLFVVKTSDTTLFEHREETLEKKTKREKKGFNMRRLSTITDIVLGKKEKQTHFYTIKLSWRTKIKLFILDLVKCGGKNRDKKLLKMIKDGSEFVNQDMSVEKIIKDLRDVRFELKHIKE